MVSKSAPSAKKVLLNLFLSICIIGLLAFGVIKTTQLNDTQQVLASTQNELTVTQSDLSDTQTTLATTETELSQTQSDLATTQANLSDTQNELSDTEIELETTTQKLEDKSSQLAQTQADYMTTSKALKTEQALSASLKSSFDNLQVNYASLTTGYGYVMKDPTYQQLKAFIAADTTDAKTYVLDSYVCEDFSFDVKTHAMQQKFRCAYVSIRFIGDKAHAIVAFNTTDRGIIYIEPQSDEEVNLQAGKHYWTQCVITTVHYTTTFNDTIERFNVIW